MCGITCFVSDGNVTSLTSCLECNIKNRGPDGYDVINFKLTSKWNGMFAASILHTQGSSLTQQPLCNQESNVLLWNGDIFDGDIISGSNQKSDTEILFQWLQENYDHITEFPPLIKGPYSFIYFDNKRKEIWFGRDPLGRHSLLWKITTKSLLITSVGHKSIENLEEVPAIGLFHFRLSENGFTESYLYQWSHVTKCLALFEPQVPETIEIPEEVIKVFDLNTNTYKFMSGDSQPLFSQEITNVEDLSSVMDKFLENLDVRSRVDDFLELLRNSCRKRITIRRNICRNCISEEDCSANHVKVAVLFSGGLDSTVIAYLVNEFVPVEEPIDLLNVAFGHSDNFDVPDRKTGFSSLEELRKLCPTRKWNFIEINISNRELEEVRKSRICHLIYPFETILDDSLGCALWFACRGQGSLNNCSYSSSAKIILLGNGADEQLAGYTRHRNLLKRNGWDELGKQLIKETFEISRRNLGRDDRVACDSGRQPRYPFLDEDLVQYLLNLPPWDKCGAASLPRGLGDKLILRLAAAKLKLKCCATFPKRAFQFGCRIAKSKEKGNDRSTRLCVT